MGKKWVEVGLSKPHRRKAHRVKEYEMNRTENAFRIQRYKRRPRRTDAEIAKANGRRKKPLTPLQKNKRYWIGLRKREGI
jgi:hypothetical protein